jgi:hypothetical protein
MLRGSNQYGREVITASEERLRARLDEVKVWLNTARFIAGEELQDSTKRAYAVGLFRYFLMLRISTKAALFEKLRSKQEKEAQERAFALSIELHSLPSEKERERLRKESIRLFEYADHCGHKQWNDHLCYNRVTSWLFDFPYIAIALTTIGLNPNDDLMPSEYQLSNPPNLKEEHPQPTLPGEAAGLGSPKDLPNLVVPPAMPQHTGSIPPVLGGHSESAGQPATLTATAGALKRRVGRPKDAATVKYNELAAEDENLSTLEICKKFDKEKVPLPDMLSSPDNSSDSWIVAYGKNRQKVGAWLREKRRPRRARGKFKRG